MSATGPPHGHNQVPPTPNIWTFSPSNFSRTLQYYVPRHLWRFVRWQRRATATSGAVWLAGLSELALQEHPGDTKPLLLVDRLSQDVVVGDGLEARLLKELGQELWKSKVTLEKAGRSRGFLLCRQKDKIRLKVSANQTLCNFVCIVYLTLEISMSVTCWCFSKNSYLDVFRLITDRTVEELKSKTCRKQPFYTIFTQEIQQIY